jgi:hypothetical protein
VAKRESESFLARKALLVELMNIPEPPFSQEDLMHDIGESQENAEVPGLPPEVGDVLAASD